MKTGTRQMAWVAVVLGVFVAASTALVLASRGDLLGNVRNAVLSILLLFWGAAIGLGGRYRPRRFAALFFTFALAWMGWGVAVRVLGMQDSFFAAAHAAAHEKVWFPALALAGLAWLHALDRTRTGPFETVKLDPDKTRRLNHVTLRDPELDVSRFPDFFILGPQRTASTWLYDCLTLHPRIFMSNGKEIHFFNTINHDYLPDHKSTDLDDYMREFQPWPDQFEAKNKVCKKVYREPFDPLVRGEATASYAAGLDDSVIEDVLTLNPELRAIIAVRDPLERAWSHAKKDLCKEKGRRVGDVPDAEFHEFFRSYYQVQCGQYSHMIDRWTAALPEGHLMVVRFDDVVRRPADLLVEVYEFLGVPSDAKYVPEVAREQINATTSDPIPDQHRVVLLELFGPELARLEEKFGWTWGHQTAGG